MAELIREIEKEDIPKLRDLMNLVFGSDDWDSIQRLGGMTNHSYKITRKDGQEYLARIPGEGTEKLINRLNEKKSTELACRLGIDSELLFFGDDGRKVMRFITDPQPIDEDVMRKRENFIQAAEIFHRLHSCGENTGVPFEVIEMASLYEKLILEKGVVLYDDYDDTKNTVMKIKKEIDREGQVIRVPCHNDSLIGNWVLDKNGKLYLIDWEYSGMNESMWDLSCLSIEVNYSEKEEKELLDAYFGFENKQVDMGDIRRFKAAKLYVDYLWTLWGLTRVPYDGDFMQNYANDRYRRLKKNIEIYNSL